MNIEQAHLNAIFIIYDEGQEMMNDEREDSNVAIKCALGQHNMVHISEVYKQTFRIY